VAVVLGSGLADFVAEIPGLNALPYGEIPNFPEVSVEGHAGRLILARDFCPRGFCALQGRVHLYEGFSASEVVFSVRALALWGIEMFVITNAAGAVNTDFSPGDLMLITDHINLMGQNPLTGPNLEALGERFPDLTRAYHPRMLALAASCGEEAGMNLRRGVYCAVAGPSYETPAEVRMLRAIGADAVGMSTVPEVIALNHLRKRVLGISCIANMAAGMNEEQIHHSEVLRACAGAKEDFAGLLLSVAHRCCHE
jgi:purine-nucleoside phosphorylase